MSDFDLDLVRDFIISRGGKIKNNELVSHFKTYLNDPRHKDTNRGKFKSIVNALAVVKLDTTGEKVLVLKKKYRSESSSETASAQAAETPLKYAAPKAKLKEAFVPRKGSEEVSNAEADDTQQTTLSDVTGGEMSLLSEIHNELKQAGLRDETVAEETSTMHRDVSQISEDVFMDAVSEQSSIYEDTKEQPETLIPSEFNPNRDNSLTESVQLEIGDVSNTGSEQDKTDDKVRFELADSSSNLADVETLEAEEPAIKVPKVEKVPEVKYNTTADAAQPSQSDVTAAARSSFSSREESSETDGFDPTQQTPSLTGSVESLGPKETVPISVKDRAKHLNKITSEVDLQSVQKAPDTLIPKVRGEGRDSAEPDYISLNQTEREWMIYSAKSDYHQLFKLLNKNPNLAKRSDFTSGYTALHWASKHGTMDVVKLLCGTPGVEVNARSNGGYTPLHLAAMQGNEDIIELLVSVYGADTNLRDYNGKKAKQYLRNAASSRSQQLLQVRRSSYAQASGGLPSTNFRRSGSYSAKISKVGHFGIQASSVIRGSWLNQTPSRSPSQSPRSSPRGSPGAVRRHSQTAMRDGDMMPPPKNLPARLRRNKKNKDRTTVSDSNIGRSDSDPAISLQQAGEHSSAIPQSVSYTSIV